MSLATLPRSIIDQILQCADVETRRTWAIMQFRRRRQRHDDECYARVLWCLAQGPDFHPAHEHKHRAPGDDSRFFYGVPPWHADGSVNCVAAPACPSLLLESTKGNIEANLDMMDMACCEFDFSNPNPGLRHCQDRVSSTPRGGARAGVPPNFGGPEPLGKNQALLDNWDANTGWNCTRCDKWVPMPPRKFEGGKEPADWWWCKECRRNKARPATLAEKRQQKAAANCRTLETYM